MANELVRPADLPARGDPTATEVVVSDNGSVVAGVTWADGVNAGRPLASQGEAEAGAQSTKAMTPLTTKQAVDAQVPGKINAALVSYTPTAGLGSAAFVDAGDFATSAQGALADTAVQPGNSALVPVGGSEGQILAKASATDGDTEWITASGGGSGGIEFSTVANLLADTTLGYSTGTVVDTGDIVRAGGLRYLVAASTNPSYTIATAGGVRLQLQTTDDGSWNIWGFGAYPGASGLAAKINTAIDWVQSIGGGTIVFPPGTYAISDTINIDPGDGVDGYADIIIRGAGRDATVLDFDGTTSTEDGIAVSGWSGRFILKDMTIIKAARHGINLADNTAPIGPYYLSRFSIENVVTEFNGSDGLLCTNSYMFSLTGVESRNNGVNGFTLRGFHTSINADRCWAGGDAVSPQGGNGNIGWDITGVTYSTFNNCSADWNETAGWRLRHSAGCVFLGCGAESNGMEGFLCVSSSADISTVPDFVRGINSVSFINCHAANNSKDGANAYANFLGISASNSYPATVVTIGCQDVNYDNPGGTSVGLNSSGGTPIYLHETAPRMQGSYTRVGSVYTQDVSVAGKYAIARRSTDQTINGPDTEAYITFNELGANSLGATLSSGAIVLPKGINRVRVTAGVFVGPIAEYVQLQVHRDGSPTLGCPLFKFPGQTYTPVGYSTSVLEVDPNGATEFKMAISHGKSPNATVIGGNDTFICVEAVA